MRHQRPVERPAAADDDFANRRRKKPAVTFRDMVGGEIGDGGQDVDPAARPARKGGTRPSTAKDGVEERKAAQVEVQEAKEVLQPVAV